MSTSTNEGEIDHVIITTTALIHSPKNNHKFHHGFLPRDEQNKRNTKTLITKEIDNLEEANSKNKPKPLIKKRTVKGNVRRKKQTIILKPLIPTNSSVSQKENKTHVENSTQSTGSSLNKKESEIFVKKPKLISSSSCSTFPDLNFETENKNKSKSKSSLSGIFSSVSNHDVKEKNPQVMHKASNGENKIKEEVDFVVRSPEPINRSIHSVDENILTVSKTIAMNWSTPKPIKKNKKFSPVEVCIAESMQTEKSLEYDIISKKNRLVKEDIHKHESLNTFDSFKLYQHPEPTVKNVLIENSSDYVERSWENSGQPVPAERVLRFMKLLRRYEKMVEEIKTDHAHQFFYK
ncbi:uncharacterized protein LOC112904339 [Agrilus planipennis]|uniref:Uncharacterized protein LOC112904339 n=1 Tax=Agrilus planipennis TaxID=224129 RepID=A0A7F5QXI6_AGRPL|nr:uncharacterized protein LOC112904339 [Agrilus planipennis]